VKIQGDQFKNTLAAEPKDSKQPGVIRIDLSGIDAVRLKCVVGSDYPPGDESQRRKVYAVRSRGTESSFLTLIEPYELAPVVKSATATAADRLRVELIDGRMQEIVLHNLDGSGKDIGVSLTRLRTARLFEWKALSSQA